MRLLEHVEMLTHYLSERCRERLTEIGYIVRNSGILTNLVTPLSDRKYAVSPWAGTRQLLTLYK